MMYHVARPGQADPACGRADPGDPVVPWVEATDPAGRYFTCVACHKALTGGSRHTLPPEGWHEDA